MASEADLPVWAQVAIGIGVDILVYKGTNGFFAKIGGQDIPISAEVADNIMKSQSGESFDDWLKNMSPEDAARYETWRTYADSGLDVSDRVKLMDWDHAPDADLYMKYKDVYDNPDYFNQLNGKINWPGANGDPNIDGFCYGAYEIETIQPGQIIDRYGSNGSGRYFSPDGTSYGERALPPFMENEPYTRYEVLKPFDVQSGPIAPWFGQPGMGTQYMTDLGVRDLISQGYIRVLN